MNRTLKSILKGPGSWRGGGGWGVGENKFSVKIPNVMKWGRGGG